MSAMRAVTEEQAPWKRYGAALDALRRIEVGASVDGDLVGHEDRVALSTRALAKAHGLDRPMVERMAVAARFHDIGKLKIDEAVLRKAGPFNPEERQAMERHASLGHSILSRIDGIDPVMLDAARYHHERFDGLGYEGLAGEDIPLVARVVAIADVHDALVQKRVYKPARPEAEVLATMAQDRPHPEIGRHAFDPALLRTFVALRLADPAFQAAEDARLETARRDGTDATDLRPSLAEFAASPVPEPQPEMEAEATGPRGP